MIYWPDLKFPPINLWTFPRIKRDYSINEVTVKRMSETLCPECDGDGYTYEGGMSMNPEVDNQVPCPQCQKETTNETD